MAAARNPQAAAVQPTEQPADQPIVDTPQTVADGCTLMERDGQTAEVHIASGSVKVMEALGWTVVEGHVHG